MCGGGGGFLADIVEETINTSLGAASFGQVGFSTSDGVSFEKGGFLNKGKDVLKEVSGAKAAEEANAESARRFREQKEQAQAARDEQKRKATQDELTKSKLAGAARQGVSGAGKAADQARGSGRFSSLGGDEQDFLGI